MDLNSADALVCTLNKYLSISDIFHISRGYSINAYPNKNIKNVSYTVFVTITAANIKASEFDVTTF